MNRKAIVIGVAGGSGSGKTTVANAIKGELNDSDVVMLQHDSYYKNNRHLSPSELQQVNYDHPDSLETSLLTYHLQELLAGRDVEVPVYDFSTHSRRQSGIIVKPARVIIVEGILIFVEKALREAMDVKIFVDTDADIRFIRRLRRDMEERGRSMESVIQQYMETVKPMHEAFVEPSRKYADVILPEGHNPICTNMVVSMIKEQLRGGETV
jgi:uridine kinase